ncbi:MULTISPECIES: NAD(P)H-binding protein [Streptomyces]|uniref:NAD(P)H-binding protein n=1 Tax=Streptomyces TaxID=1883 RepID=UPI001039A095|nr:MULTISPECIES: NAD(P)H-binding protein [Streptomyces]MBT3076335.1 NAD(P)H-binding protein [Streptomyces sp. COG21]MBT3079153.1 NAD(P)H-binding protein [Streptomyces sp. COG20]MBT3088019.1 NAD(P)H-binding protein [Streptomyces sp. CYG21]MBT3095206.1 NAD(P)H-binding protein [Streptomyces sp. CBG30]MBT3106980.1 NAD(P)H-binding protein [Streptomyces sp. COG19]
MTQPTEAAAHPSSPVLVLGGTGKTGRRVVARLRDLGVEVRAASRSGGTRFDWESPDTWAPALKGVAAVYIVPLDTEPSPTPAFVEQAVAAGVRRLVLLSARGVDVPGYFGSPLLDDGPHLRGEQAVRASGLAWTILRPGWFAQNFSEGVFLEGVRDGELALPVGDGRAAYIDVDDIAAVAVAALTEDGHDGEVYELSGPRALSVPEVLDEIAKASGRRAAYAPLEESAFRDALVVRGMTEVEADLWTAALDPIRTSREAPLKDGVHRALGRPPRDVSDVFRDAAAEGAWR